MTAENLSKYRSVIRETSMKHKDKGLDETSVALSFQIGTLNKSVGKVFNELHILD